MIQNMRSLKSTNENKKANAIYDTDAEKVRGHVDMILMVICNEEYFQQMI